MNSMNWEIYPIKLNFIHVKERKKKKDELNVCYCKEDEFKSTR